MIRAGLEADASVSPVIMTVSVMTVDITDTTVSGEPLTPRQLPALLVSRCLFVIVFLTMLSDFICTAAQPSVYCR